MSIDKKLVYVNAEVTIAFEVPVDFSIDDVKGLTVQLGKDLNVVMPDTATSDKYRLRYAELSRLTDMSVYDFNPDEIVEPDEERWDILDDSWVHYRNNDDGDISESNNSNCWIVD